MHLMRPPGSVVAPIAHLCMYPTYQSGVFVFGLLLSSLGDMFHRTSGGIRRAVALRDKLSNLEVWSSRRGFPPELLLSMRCVLLR